MLLTLAHLISTHQEERLWYLMLQDSLLNLCSSALLCSSAGRLQLLLILQLLCIQMISEHLRLLSQTGILHAELASMHLHFMLVVHQGFVAAHSCIQSVAICFKVALAGK